MTEFETYRNKCRSATLKLKSQIFKNWDGFDYYDKLYIKDNLNLHYTNSMYPSIDHKVAILYGFLNNISIETICSIENLCITKRGLNTSKNQKSEVEFLAFLASKTETI